MLNNFHFVALHVFMCTMPSFVISSQGCLVKFDAVSVVVLLFEFAALHICYSQGLNIQTFEHLTVENIRYKFRKVIKCNKLHHFGKVIEIVTLLLIFKHSN